MKTRLYSDGYNVRVDMGATGETWPNCQGEHPGFPFLGFPNAWQEARNHAIHLGATEITVETGERPTPHMRHIQARMLETPHIVDYWNAIATEGFERGHHPIPYLAERLAKSYGDLTDEQARDVATWIRDQRK